MDNAPVSIALVDANRCYVFGNRFFCETYGISSEAIVGMSSRLIFLSEDDWTQVGAAAYPIIKAGGRYDSEHLLRRADGSPYWGRIIGKLVDPATPLLGTIWVIDDLTDRKLAEQRAAAERANVAKSKFLAAASHDLRQPFQAMMLYLNLLDDMIQDPFLRKAVTGLQAAMEAGQELLDALLHISTLEAGTTDPKVETVRVDDLLRPLVSEYGEQAQKRGLQLRYVSCSAWVATDPVLFRRMLRNLLSNSIKYTDAGRILLGARRLSGGAVSIEVWDTGCGIPPQSQEDIWEEFTQLHNPERDRSKGLGLAIVARTGQLLGHSVGVQSWPEKGSVFRIGIVHRAG